MNIGVIGFGSIGRLHASILAEFDIVKSIYICDPFVDESAVGEFKRSVSVDVQHTNIVDDVARKANALYICSPTHLHDEHLQSVVTHNKPVFVEKPLSTRSHTFESIAAYCEKQFVVVGANMRYHPGVVAGRQMLQKFGLDSVIGARAYFNHNLRNWRPGTDYLQSYSANREMGGGVLLDCIHEMDYVQWLFGAQESTSIFAKTSPELGVDVEDHALVVMEHETGIRSTVELDYLSPVKKRGLEIRGTTWRYSWYSTGKVPESMRIEMETLEEQEYVEETFSDYRSMYKQQTSEFLDVISRSKPASETSLMFALDEYSTIKSIEDWQSEKAV